MNIIEVAIVLIVLLFLAAVIIKCILVERNNYKVVRPLLLNIEENGIEFFVGKSDEEVKSIWRTVFPARSLPSSRQTAISNMVDLANNRGSDKNIDPTW